MRVGDYRAPVVPPARPLDRGALPHYWHPDREGVEQAPDDFRRALALVHPDVAAVRPPPGAPIDKRRWLIWYRKASVRHPLCPGWLLLFVWPPEGYDPIPLDNRVLANLYMIDGRRFTSGAHYFDSIVKGMEAEKAQRTAADKAHVADMAKDYWDSTQIKNIGAGNKFALHHDGTVIPSRGERAWTAERAKHMLPETVGRGRRERPR